MNVIAIIPARMGSSRFPGKPLAEICGIPMVGHVYLRTALSKSLQDCYVATCDIEIKDYVESIGGKAVMTSNMHERCSDRCAEAMLKIEAQAGKRVDVVVMVQGDEPLVTPAMIDSSVTALKDGMNDGAGVACLMGHILTSEEFQDPNAIKVVIDRNDYAMYMSREPIPTQKRGAVEGPWLKQICVIPFARDYLMRFNEMEPTALEIAESVDLNRCLENGDRVKMGFSPDPAISVDTPQDLIRAEAAMKNDVLFSSYAAKFHARSDVA